MSLIRSRFFTPNHSLTTTLIIAHFISGRYCIIDSMKLIVGLGNPEKRYDGTRHNIGFAVLDSYAADQKATWKQSPRFKAYLAELDMARVDSVSQEAERILLVKPTTYYNLVGESVRAISDFYKITPENILVIHDDHALPFGVVRTREKGSDAGNNGIKSLNAHVGPNTRRIRIGTGAELLGQVTDADFVLSKFSTKEKDSLALLQKYINKIIESFRLGNFQATTQKNNPA